MTAGLALLGALGGALVLVAVVRAVARRRSLAHRGVVTRRVAVRDAGGHHAGWSRVHGGLDPGENRVVVRWLAVVYRLASPLARAGVSPDLLSATSIWLTAWVVPAAAAAGRWPLLGALAVPLAGLGDGLDGAVAVIADRATRHGAVLDFVADRVGEGLLLAALWFLGAPLWLVLAAATAVGWLEGVRRYGVRRIGGAGGRITPGERPTRLILIGLGLLGAGLLPNRATASAVAVAAAVLGVCAVSGGLLLADVTSRRAGR